jgi:hypothetical protein
MALRQRLPEDFLQIPSHLCNNPDTEENQPSCQSGTTADHPPFRDLAARRIERIFAISGHVRASKSSEVQEGSASSLLVAHCLRLRPSVGQAGASLKEWIKPFLWRSSAQVRWPK